MKAPNIKTFNDVNGKPSLMRWLVAYVVVMFTTVWAVLSVKEGSMYVVDWQQAAMVVGALLAKAHQATGEKRHT